MRSILRFPFLWILILANITVYAQRTPEYADAQRERILSDDNVLSVALSDERQTPLFISVRPGSYFKGQTQDLLRTYLEVRQGIDELKPERIVTVPGGFEVQEFRQYYKGIPVEHARYTAMIRFGSVHFFNGSWFDVPANLSVAPSMSHEAALSRATQRIGARKYAWQHISELLSKTSVPGEKAALAEELKEYLPQPELVIVKNYNASGVANVRLAYKYNIYSFEPLSRQWVYVDAHNGEILLIDKIIKHVDEEKLPAPSSVATMVQTRYSGLRSINTKQISGNDPNNGATIVSSNPLELYAPGSATYALIDDSRGKGIETYDLNGVGGLPVSVAPAYNQAKSFTDVDNNWTLGEHVRGAAAESENDDIAWDAHWGAAVVYDYWKQKHGRLSFDGKDAKIKSYIHSGIGYDNAFWNGKVMTYGDGSYPAKSNGFRPLTSLDVCGHEIGHGVCEFTSDLVYERESGAMNEGFSDIWAACVEYFAISNIDPGFAAVYKPFHIGEQIAANPARPLRRMDSPQAEGDPDTYGGTFWKNPACAPPTLANDYCGVHTNSGVLNKWFYLMTVGSGAGSGPDAAFAGVDDGLNDVGESYQITGLGFATSEKIAYLTELMLTANATFAEARNVSVNIAVAMSENFCSPIVQTVMDAWYAVNVGEAFVQPCTITYGFIYQPGDHVSEGKNGAGCNVETVVTVPLVLPPNSTGSVTLSGTATNGLDYRIPVTSVSNTTSTGKQDSVIVYVINDAVVEGDETIVLNITVTNAGANPVNSTYTLNVIEDDVIPVFGTGKKMLLNETFTGADGFADPAGWIETLEVPEEPTGTHAAKGKNQWGIFGNQLAITGREENTGAQLPNGTYNNLSISTTRITSPLIDARGLNTLQLKFDFLVQGEVEPNTNGIDTWPALDYMAIIYSLDGNTWYEFGRPPFARFASNTPLTGTFDYPLPAFLENKQFYLGFRWNNDPYVGGPVSVSIDNLTLQGSTRQLENDPGHNSRETIFSNQDVYFYSVQDGEAVGRVKNNSARNLGCTNLYIEKTGNSSFNLYQSNKDGIHKVSDKIVRIETGLIYKASSTITLYYSEEQLSALELATGVNRVNFNVYHVGDAAYTMASSLNTKRYVAVYSPLPGVGGSYTITLSDRANGSYALGYPVSLPGLTRTDSRILTERQNWKFSPLYPNPSFGNAFLKVTAPVKTAITIEVTNSLGQTVEKRVQDLTPGENLLEINSSAFINGTYSLSIKNEKGELIQRQTFVKY